MKKLIVIPSLFFIFSAYSQIIFDTTFARTEFANDLIQEVIEDADGNFFATTLTGKNTSWDACIIKISPTGEVLKQVQLETDTAIILRSILIRAEDILFIGDKHVVNEKSLVCFYSYNTNLELNWSKDQLLFLSNTEIGYSDANINSSNEIIYCGNVGNEPFYDGNAFIVKFSSDADSLDFNLFELPAAAQYFWELEQEPLGSSYYAAGWQFHPNANDQDCSIVKLRENFEIDTIYKPVAEGIGYDILTGVSNLKFNTDTTFISASRVNVFRGLPDNENLCIQLYDTSFNKLKEIQFGNEYEGREYFPYKGLDFLYNGEIYVGGISPYSPSPILSNYNMLSKFDRNMNLLWTKFYGGDASYALWKVLATQDGGCLMAGTFQNQNMSYTDIFLIKVDADGNTSFNTGVDKTANIRAYEQILYPNPGSGKLHVKTAVQRLGGKFTMSDISGKIVLQTTINERETTINTQKLSKGIYFYNYFYQNQALEQGKWIKE